MNELLIAFGGVAGTVVVALVGYFGQRKSARQEHELSMYDRVLVRNSQLEDDAVELRRRHNEALDQIEQLLTSCREKDRKLSEQADELRRLSRRNPP